MRRCPASPSQPPCPPVPRQEPDSGGWACSPVFSRKPPGGSTSEQGRGALGSVQHQQLVWLRGRPGITGLAAPPGDISGPRTWPFPCSETQGSRGQPSLDPPASWAPPHPPHVPVPLPELHRTLRRCVRGWRGKHFFKETLCHYFIYSVKNSKASFLPEEQEGASHPPRTPSAGRRRSWAGTGWPGGSPLPTPQLPHTAHSRSRAATG